MDVWSTDGKKHIPRGTLSGEALSYRQKEKKILLVTLGENFRGGNDSVSMKPMFCLPYIFVDLF